jgi:uncharacterized repeat protein (TIGR03803 family)
MRARACLILAAWALSVAAAPAMLTLNLASAQDSGGGNGFPPWVIGPVPVVPPIIIDPILPIFPVGPINPGGPILWPGQNGPYFSTSVFTGTDGNLYGVTLYGGDNDTSAGTVFSETPDGGNLTTLYSFDADGNGDYPNGNGPFVLLQGPNGNLYGATSGGGLGSFGTIFELSLDGGNFTTLDSFDNGDNGGTPNSLILASDQNFYGTTSTGGTGGGGTVFEMTPDGTLTTLFGFSGDNDGANPSGLAEGGDGNLYGSTTAGGANGTGTVFTVAADGTLTTLAAFAAPAGFADGTGSLPYSATSTLTGTDGNTYGVTMFGGNFDDSAGSVFSLTPNGTVTTLFSFDSDGAWNYPDGSNPFVLIQGTDGNLYGATSNGGANGFGTIFELAPDGSGFTTLTEFDSTNNGAYPNNLILASDGNFYGTTTAGGTSDSGTVFKLTPDGTLTTLFTFSGDVNGAYPISLVEGSDGNLYGVTAGGGANGSGTLFQVAPDGTLSTLAATSGSGNFYAVPLVNTLGAAGSLPGGAVGGNGTTLGQGTGKTPKAPPHRPAVTCTVIGAKARLAFSAKIIVHGVASGTSSIKKVEYAVNGGVFQPATGAKRWTFAATALKKGKNTIVIRVTNSQGQQTTQTITVNRRR